MFHQCLLAAVCTAICWLSGPTLAMDVPCPGGGLAFLQSKWALWFRIHDLNNDGRLSESDWTIFSNLIATRRNYTSQQTQDLHNGLMNSTADIFERGNSEMEYVAHLSDWYVNSGASGFRKLANASLTGFWHAIMQNDTHMTEAQLALVAEDLHHPELNVIGAIYFRNHDGNGLTLEQLVDKISDDFVNPCPTVTGLLETYLVEENGHE